MLFPYARERFAAFLGEAGLADVDVQALGSLASREGHASATLEDLAAFAMQLMDRDSKQTELKQLQGRIWKQGYADGALRGHVYADVVPALDAWAAAGCTLHIYSSGSIAAQKLLFGHSEAGNLCPRFASHYDTTTGPKQQPASYTAIATDLQRAPGQLLFLTGEAKETRRCLFFFFFFFSFFLCFFPSAHFPSP